MNTHKKRSLAFVLLSLIGMVMAGNQLFAERAVAVEMIQGVVMDAGNSRLLITPDSGDVMEFAVAPNARVMRDGEATKLEGLQAKDHVSVMCTGSGQDRVATDIVARSPL